MGFILRCTRAYRYVRDEDALAEKDLNQAVEMLTVDLEKIQNLELSGLEEKWGLCCRL